MGLLVAATGPISAQASKTDAPYKFKASIYLWGAGIDGTTQRDDDIDVSFSDIWDNLDFAFMGAFEARKSKWSAAADVIYLKLADGESGTVGLMDVDVSADVELTGWVLNFHGARNVFENESISVDVLLGARYLDVDTELTVSVSGVGQTTFKPSDDVWDAIAGVKGEIKFSKSWFLPYYLDIGTGQSDFTWQGFGGVGYAFKHVNLVLGYRYLDWQFDSDSA